MNTIRSYLSHGKDLFKLVCITALICSVSVASFMLYFFILWAKCGIAKFMFGDF